jgi:ETFB lysine methyltransferase
VTEGNAIATALPVTGAQSVEALRQDLERQFVTDLEPVRVGDWPIELLRPRNSDDLITEADFVRDERLPYWADLWPSARVLAEHLLRSAVPESVPRPRLVELGCGLGLVTAAALRAGYDVMATDYYADALRFTRANATRAAGREPATRLVDWRDFPQDLGQYDRVVAADVLYEHAYAPLISRAIAQMLTAGGAAIIADPGRVAAPAFLAGLEQDGLFVAGTEVHPYEAEPAIRQQITLYTLGRVPTRRPSLF